MTKTKIENLEAPLQELTPEQAEEVQGGAVTATFVAGVLTVVGEPSGDPAAARVLENVVEVFDRSTWG